MALVKCKECGHELSKKADKCPNCGAPQKSQQIGCGSLIVLAIVGWIAFSIANNGDSPVSTHSSVSSPPASRPSSSVQAPPLELLSFRCEKEYSYVFVRGEVRNRSNSKLDNVTAVGKFRNSGGALVKSETALIEYNPLMPGQTSPFEVGGTDNPEITNCNIGFKHLLGGAIPYVRPSDTASGGSELVSNVQKLLNELGYSVGAADGIVGPKTKAAIEAFQKANGLEVDGEPTDSLLGRLRTARK